MTPTWHARKVQIHKGTINEIRQHIPDFAREPFRTETGGTNQHLDIIVRKPLKKNQGFLFPSDDETHIPIATVSKQYSLVQHHDVLDALETVLRENNIDAESLETELKLTEYGERMWFSFILPSYGFDSNVSTYGFVPEDGYPVVLKVNVLNSVDKTTALEIMLSWYRLVCANGMIYGEDVDFRKIHLSGLLNYDVIKEFLRMQLERERFSRQKERFGKWYATKVIIMKLTETKPGPGQIERWLDTVVSKKWSINAAARIYHIAKTGYDGKFVNHTRKTNKVTFQELTLESQSSDQIPGTFAPVRNAYDISQVLSWIAGQRGTIQGQLAWLMDIPNLMEALLKTEKPITLGLSGQSCNNKQCVK